VSLEVEAGEIICLLGPSGCGKTTLLRMIAGLERPDSGQVFFVGQEITRLAPHRRGFGMMFQDFALFPHKNVFDNVAFGLQTRGDSPAAVRRRVAEMLNLVDLRGFEDRDISLLSGGEQALTAIALLFGVFQTNLAPICVLDEVDAPLDDANVDRFCSMLERMAATDDTRFIIITHHRLTMARMDRLFGVTMSERGVSQLVSVDLKTTEGLRKIV